MRGRSAFQKDLPDLQWGEQTLGVREIREEATVVV